MMSSIRNDSENENKSIKKVPYIFEFFTNYKY